MSEQDNTNADAVKALEDVGSKLTEYLTDYLAKANERILAEALEGRARAEEVVEALSTAYKQAANLSTSYARQADLLGISSS